jgi:hypothetical protein
MGKRAYVTAGEFQKHMTDAAESLRTAPLDTGCFAASLTAPLTVLLSETAGRMEPMGTCYCDHGNPCPIENAPFHFMDDGTGCDRYVNVYGTDEPAEQFYAHNGEYIDAEWCDCAAMAVAVAATKATLAAAAGR